MPFDLNRRKVLKYTGAATGIAALAGCLGGDDDDDDDTDDDVGNGEDDEARPIDEERVEVDYDDIVEGGTLYTGLSANPPNWDPPQIGDTTSNMTSGVMIYEGLLTTDFEGEIHPWLATDWEEIETQDITEADYEDYMSEVPEDEEEMPPDILMGPTEDGLILTTDDAADAVDDGLFGVGYEFDIREGVEFHNGDTLTAEHFVQSYDRWIGANRWGVEMVPWYLDARATGDYTLELYGQLPDADFFRSISLAVFPEEHWDMEPGAISPIEDETPIGTGVWEFEDFQDEEFVTLTRNDDHWFDPDEYEGPVPDGFPAQPPLETIEYEIIPDDSSRAAALQDDIIHHTSGVASDTLSDYHASEDFRVSAVTSGGYLFFEYPNQQEPWDDPRMCRGVNHMIPRPQIVNTVFDGWQTEAAFPLSPTSSHEGTHDYEAMEDELGDYNEYDPERGAELVEEVFEDYDIEAPFETRIITNSDNDDRVQSVGLIQEVMNQSGLFEVEVETFEWGRFVEMLISGDLWEENQIIVVGLSSGWSPDGYARSVSHPDNQGGACCNHTHYENDTVTQLIDDARYGPDVIGEEGLDTRRDRYEDLWRELMEDPPVSWISFGVEDDIVNENVVKGWNAYPFNSSKYSASLFSPTAGQVVWTEGEDE